MDQIWVAFIVMCNLNVCNIDKTYSKEHFGLTEQLCLNHARSWAILMKLNHNKEYAYGCEKVIYEPKKVN